MKMIQSCVGKFWHFDLARQLERRGCLKAIFTGYPRQKLFREELPTGKVHTFPWLHAPFMFMGRFIYGSPLHRELAWWDSIVFDRHVSKSPLLRDTEVFIGLSGSSLLSGKRVQALGGKYICDRGSSHILFQDRILRDEYARWGIPFAGIDPRVIAREEEEYAAADAITIPSGFVQQTFEEFGVPTAKLKRLPYGVDLACFKPVAEADDQTFEVLFAGSVSIRKGVPYLLEAFTRLSHPRKRLRIVGGIPKEARSFLNRFPQDCVELLGHRPQHELNRLMSQAHVLVLPSIEDGFGLVLAQAMACGCALIASSNTGASDLFTDGVEGFIIEPRSADALLERLSCLAEDPVRLRSMRAAALQKVRSRGGWRQYGDHFVEVCHRLIGNGN